MDSGRRTIYPRRLSKLKDSLQNSLKPTTIDISEEGYRAQRSIRCDNIQDNIIYINFANFEVGFLISKHG